MNAYFSAFARAFDYSGRSTRGEYWLFQLGWLIVSLLVYFVVALNWPRLVTDRANVVNVGLLIAHAVPSLSLTVRRLHDSGHSAAWLAWLLLPLIGAIVLLCMSLARPDEGENDYGPDPRDGDFEPERSSRRSRHEPDSDPVQLMLPVEQLERLQALRAGVVIDEQEFAAMKAKLLSGLTK